jgi:hypothetical protein
MERSISGLLSEGDGCDHPREVRRESPSMASTMSSRVFSAADRSSLLPATESAPSKRRANCSLVLPVLGRALEVQLLAASVERRSKAAQQGVSSRHVRGSLATRREPVTSRAHARFDRRNVHTYRPPPMDVTDVLSSFCRRPRAGGALRGGRRRRGSGSRAEAAALRRRRRPNAPSRSGSPRRRGRTRSSACWSA